MKNPTKNLGKHALRGAVPWNKGVKGSIPSWNKGRTKEIDERIRIGTAKSGLSKRGKHYPKINIAKKGKPLSPEHRLKISAAIKGRVMSKGWRMKIALGRTGKRHSEEAKRKLSEFRMGKIPWNKGKTNIYTPEQLKKISDTLKTRWQDPNFAAEQVQKQGRRPNNNELYLDAILQLSFPKEWKYVGDGQIWIAGRNPDFFNINGKRSVIELDSKYWHKDKQKDAERNDKYIISGYKILSLNEDYLEDEELLIKKINEFIVPTPRVLITWK